jgi:ABC-type branched-subunit amino acid transport system ATPase component/ABC-type branched-subunit amino acid transport system permease subunit
MNRLFIPLALGVGAVAFLTAPLILTSSYFKFLLILVFVYAIVSIGLNILIGYAGQFSLGHAGLMAIGAYLSAMVSIGLSDFPILVSTGANVWIGMLVGTVAAGVAGVALAFPALRLKGPYLAMVTIAFGWVVWKVLLNWTSVTGGDLGITSIPRPRFGAAIFNVTAYYYLAGVLMIVAFVLQRNLVDSDFGRKIRALKHSEIAAASVGIDVHREKVAVFVISAMFAGLGGALFAHLQNFINPDDFQFVNSIFFLLTMLFGGAGTLIGPFIGSALLTFLPQLLQDAEQYRLIIFAVIILITLFFLPHGVAGILPFVGKDRRYGAASDTSPASLDSLKPKPCFELSTPSDGSPILAATDIGKTFGGVTALRNVSIVVEPGKVHALIGPNGAGKTTLVNIMSGFYRPDSGAIAIGGAATRLISLHHAARLGIVRTFQTIKLFGDMTAREHVMVGGELQSSARILDYLLRTERYRREERRRRELADALLEFVGLGAFADAPASALAYGHRRLLEIARALAARPRLLLLDEPAAGLVANEIETLARLIEKLRERGLAIVLIEHHMDLVIAVSDTVTVLDYGEVISRGAVDTARNDPRVIEAYLGTAEDQEYLLAQG